MCWDPHVVLYMFMIENGKFLGREIDSKTRKGKKDKTDER